MVHSFHTTNILTTRFGDRDNLSGKQLSGITERPSKADNQQEASAAHGSIVEGGAASQPTAPMQSSDRDADIFNSPHPVETAYLFQRFMRDTGFSMGLRVQYAPANDRVFSGNWVTVDLAKLETIARAAGIVTLDFGDDYFDKVLCTDLNRISRPASLIGELRRVLKRRGQIWAQAPLSDNQDSENFDGSGSYWYFTPEGFQVLFEEFDEIVCSVYQDSLHHKPTESYFYGIKPEIVTDDLDFDTNNLFRV